MTPARSVTRELLHEERKDFAHADLRGADLRKAKLGFTCLMGAKLDGADLSEAILTCVDLSYASLQGATLRRTTFEYLNATRADFSSAVADESQWSVVDLSRASLRDASVTHAMFRGCCMERAALDGADFTHAKLAYANCTGASFRETLLRDTLTVGSTFFLADLATAKQFFLSRQIVAEILRREVENDFLKSQLVGAVELAPQWCYHEWKAWLDFNPSFREVALEIFAKYPDSGCHDALLEGYRDPDVGSPELQAKPAP